ncbi:MAG: TRAM domain-containing protein, partial [Patescibacteria group bacterium]
MNVHIDKLVFGGQAMGKTPDGKIAFVWNALPGEDVELDVIKNKKTHIEGNAVRILSSSSNRIPAREDHFLSCSPWQIMTFEEENTWKIAMAKETYEKIGGLENVSLEIVADEKNQYGYRNKIE